MSADDDKWVKIGVPVHFRDPDGKVHNALVTAVMGSSTAEFPPSCNLLYLSDDESAIDQYGRQVIRVASIPHEKSQQAPANFWRGM